MAGDQILKEGASEDRIETNLNIQRDDPVEDSPSMNSLGRREFIGNMGMMTTATLAASVIGLSSISGTLIEEAEAAEVGPLNSVQRRRQAFRVRRRAAQFQKKLPLPDHPCNGDEALYPNKIGNYTKGLPHNSLGEVDVHAYDALLNALSSGSPDDFEGVPISGDIKLKNPQSGLVFELIGADSHHLGTPPAPSSDSAEEAAEIAELYWMALARDVHFSDYETNQLTNDAAVDLSTFSDFKGPKIGGRVTTGTLFRADIPGVLVGSFLSQFLLKTIPAGPMVLEPKIRTLLPVDYIVSYDEWLSVQNGIQPANALSPDVYDRINRFLRDGRDLAENQHWDWPAQAAVNALLIVFGLEGKSPAEIFLANIGGSYKSRQIDS